MDKVKESIEAQQASAQATQNAATAAVGACPDSKQHFVTAVNKGSIRMQTWQSHLNEMYERGYRLAHVFEQEGNTVQVYERPRSVQAFAAQP